MLYPSKKIILLSFSSSLFLLPSPAWILWFITSANPVAIADYTSSLLLFSSFQYTFIAHVWQNNLGWSLLSFQSYLPLYKENLECLTWFCISFLCLTWATPQAPLLTYFTLDIKCRNPLGFSPKSFSLLILDTLPWWSPLLRLQLLCVTEYADNSGIHILSLNLFPDSYDKSTWWSC